jgi:hypothetical protein
LGGNELISSGSGNGSVLRLAQTNARVVGVKGFSITESQQRYMRLFGRMESQRTARRREARVSLIRIRRKETVGVVEKDLVVACP